MPFLVRKESLLQVIGQIQRPDNFLSSLNYILRLEAIKGVCEGDAMTGVFNPRPRVWGRSRSHQPPVSVARFNPRPHACGGDVKGAGRRIR